MALVFLQVTALSGRSEACDHKRSTLSSNEEQRCISLLSDRAFPGDGEQQYWCNLIQVVGFMKTLDL